MLLKIKEEFQQVTGAKTLAAIAHSILNREHLFDQEKEHFVAVGLNTKNVVQYVDLVSLGTLDASLVHPRECFRHAVEQGASSVAFIHNHPSGDMTPSSDDRTVTERLILAGKVLGIDVLDHVIVGNGTKGHLALRDNYPGLWM